MTMTRLLADTGLTLPGEGLTRWIVRFAVAAYFVSLAIGIRWPQRDRLARLWWSIACAACLVHIGLAMHFYHDWSHAKAYAHTARQTRELIGLDWGGGVYFNYLFELIWSADVAWWWISPRSRETRPRWLVVLVHAYLLFIVFNATVVFGAGATRWMDVAALSVIAWMACRRSMTR